MIFFNFNNSSSWDNLTQYISPTCLVIIFIIERYISFRYRKKDTERSWYFNVIINPNTEKISLFFSALHEQFKNSSEILSKSTNKKHNQYINAKRTEIGKFQEIKRNFEFDVLLPIVYKYPITGNELTAILNQIEDDFTKQIDANPIDTEFFIQQLSMHKAKWIGLLFQPIS